ncbi:hypothetical protein Tco_0458635 [Tanacetum coccineum]
MLTFVHQYPTFRVYQGTSTLLHQSLYCANDIWENVKMILEGSELTKDDRNPRYTNVFETLRIIKGETIQGILTNMRLHANEYRIMMEQFGQPINDPLGTSVSGAQVQQRVSCGSRCPVEDTMRIIKERPFQEKQYKRKWCSWDVGGQNREEAISIMVKRNPSVLTTKSGQYWDEEQSLFLAVENRVPSLQTMCHDQSLIEDPFFDGRAGTSYDSIILLMVHDHDTFVNHLDGIMKYTRVQTDEQNNHALLTSILDYTSNMLILLSHDQSLEDNVDHSRKDKIEDRLYKQDQSVQTVHMLCKPKSFYDEKHKVAIGYKNPVCLARAKQAQSALYNGHVLVTTNHTPTVIHDSEDTHDNNRKKAETLAPKPISALTVYPPNTPVKLVPRILPTKSQVKINLYVLTQLFTEFDKTCKTRITPSGLTEGERGFEQTKRCYLTEVIPFFKTLKEHFVGVQTALFKEVKEMEEIFDQMNNEVDKNTVDKQCAEIEKKNLLIENENLIVNCLSTQLLYDVEKSRCLDLEADMSKVHDESKLISKLEGECLNLQLKWGRSCEPYNANDVTALIEQNECVRVELEEVKQHYKELFESIQITRASTNEKTSSLLTQIEDLKAQLEGNLKVAARSSVKTKVLAPGMYAIDVEPIPPRLKNNRNAHLTYINHLKESVETVREIVEEARVVKPLDNVLNYACQYTKLSQELVEYVIGTCPKEFTERDSKAPSIPLTRKKQVTFTDTCSTSTNNTQKHGVHQKTQPSNVQVIPSTGVSSSTRASGSKPRSNTKHNRILPAKSVNNKKVEDHPRTNKSVWTKVNRVDSSISSKHVVINSNSESVCKTCNKCLNSANHEMCVVNILSSVNATPTVKIVLNKGKQIWKPKGKLSDNSLNKTKQIWQPKGKLFDNSLKKTKQVWKATGKLFANVGYQWRPTGKKFTSGKLNCGYQWRPTGKKFALGELCPLTRLPVTCTTVSANQQDPNTNWGSEIPNPPNSTVFKCRWYRSSFGLAPSPVPATTYIPPTDKDMEMLFQPMFIEYFDQSTDGEPVPTATVVNALIVSTNKYVSTTIAQDAPSTSHSLSSSQVHPLVFPQGVATGPTIKDTSITQADLHPSVNPVAGEPGSAQSTSGDVSLAERDVKKREEHDPSFSESGYRFRRVKPSLGSTELFWNTLTHDVKTGVYSFQFNEHWLTLSVDLLRKALNVGSNSKQSHVALAGPNPEHMQDVTTNIPPTDKDLEILFQLMFNEYFEQSTNSEPVPMATVVNTPIVSMNTSVSTSIAQDAPSTSHSLSSLQVHPPVFPQGVVAGPTIKDTSIIQADLYPSVNPVVGEPSSAQSTLGDVSLAEPNQVTQPPDHLRRWTKDHPLDNIVGNPSRPVSTRKQLASDALWCLDLQSDSMDEYGDVLKNKASDSYKGISQEGRMDVKTLLFLNGDLQE